MADSTSVADDVARFPITNIPCRSLKEIVAAVPDVEKKDVARFYKEMRRVLQIHQDDLGVMGAESVVRRFCKSAGIVREETIAVALSLSQNIMKISSTQREPESVATASIFIGKGHTAHVFQLARLGNCYNHV